MTASSSGDSQAESRDSRLVTNPGTFGQMDSSSSSTSDAVSIATGSQLPVIGPSLLHLNQAPLAASACRLKHNLLTWRGGEIREKSATASETPGPPSPVKETPSTRLIPEAETIYPRSWSVRPDELIGSNIHILWNTERRTFYSGIIQKYLYF